MEEHNQIILSSFSGVSIRRRVQRELDKLYPLFTDVVISKVDEAQSDDTLDILSELRRRDRPAGFGGSLRISIRDKTENNIPQKYEFVLTENYPFVPPKIWYQGRLYTEFLKTGFRSKPGLDLFRRVVGKDCFCCHSLTCADNWSPSITISVIMEEIRRVKSARQNIINKLLADKIKARYLVPDIDLDCWFF
jgi:hypothetical protein